jgi:hypothetical protein
MRYPGLAIRYTIGPAAISKIPMQRDKIQIRVVGSNPELVGKPGKPPEYSGAAAGTRS